MVYFKRLLFATLVILSACGGGEIEDDDDNNGQVGDTPPTVNAGADQSVIGDSVVTLSGSGADADGAVTFSWSQTAGESVSLSSNSTSNPTFVAPSTTGTTQLTFSLTVTDSAGNNVSDSITVSVSNADTTPTADAGPDQTVNEGETVFLAGLGSDTEGAVTVLWSQVSGTSVTLSNGGAVANPTFTAPLVSSNEVLVFRLTVTDSGGASVVDDVSITINDITTTPPSSAQSYLFYSNSLNAVDPTNPTAPILIEETENLISPFPGVSTAAMFRLGDYDPSTHAVTNEHNHAVIYPRADGRIFQVSALNSSSLSPMQVSDESEADTLCTTVMRIAPVRRDFTNADNSPYLYVLPGTDNVCSTDDDVWKMVHLGMSAADSPIFAKKVVSDYLDVNSGVIGGWLVHDDGELKRCNAEFAGCISITQVTEPVIWFLNINSEIMVLRIANNLHLYSTKNHTLSPARFSTPTDVFSPVMKSDGTTLYFAIDNLLYQLAGDGTSDATLLHTASSDIATIEIGEDYVLFQLGNNEIQSIAKTGGISTSLATVTNGQSISLMYAKGTKVYYNKMVVSTGIRPLFAGVINEDSSGVSELADASWFGGLFKTTYDLDRTTNYSEMLDRIFLQQVNIGGTAGGWEGATIKVVNLATAEIGLTMGTLPESENITSFQCSGFGDNSFCKLDVMLSGFFQMQSDIFFLNATIENSLKRVTDTTDENESVSF